MDDPKDPKEPKDYEVGYGKPPRETRFKSGTSGNPKGRRKGSKNMKSLVNEVMDEVVEVKENGRVRKMPRIEALVRQLINKAHSGDRHAMRELLYLRIKFDELEQLEPEAPELQRNSATWMSILKRVEKIATASEIKSTDSELETA